MMHYFSIQHSFQNLVLKGMMLAASWPQCLLSLDPDLWLSAYISYKYIFTLILKCYSNGCQKVRLAAASITVWSFCSLYFGETRDENFVMIYGGNGRSNQTQPLDVKLFSLLQIIIIKTLDRYCFNFVCYFYCCYYHSEKQINISVPCTILQCII